MEVSVFSVQVSACIFFLTPDTRHLKIWCLEFDALQCSITPVDSRAKHLKNIEGPSSQQIQDIF
jgi:hypothetical protein